MSGRNTVSGDLLLSFVERVEAIKERQADCGADMAIVMAEAKGQGFNTSAIKYVVKIRAEKPHDRAEREAMRDMYLHAAGLDIEPPLFRFANLAAIDISSRDQVIERMKEFVPSEGHIDVKIGKVTVRLTRDKDGVVHEDELTVVTPPAPRTDTPVAMKPAKEPAPDVDADGAYELGRIYAIQNRPVIDNPFPFGDPRRAKFDQGWRKETGGDGMGPSDPNDKKK